MVFVFPTISATFRLDTPDMIVGYTILIALICIDDPDAKRMSEIFLHFGSSISSYPCIKKRK